MSGTPLPAFYARRDDGGIWHYSWWDDATDHVIGEPPQRRKLTGSVSQLLSAILADASRHHATYPGTLFERDPADATGPSEETS